MRVFCVEVVLSFGLTYFPPAHAAEMAPKPNIVYILADDLDYITGKRMQKWLDNRKI